MDGVDTEVDGTAWLDEVMDAAAPLRREVPNGGSARGAVSDEDVRWELMRGVNEAAGGLEPWLPVLGMREKVPAEDYGRDRNTRVVAAAYGNSDIRVGGQRFYVRCRRPGLPEWHDVAGELELAAEGAGVDDGGDDFADFDAALKETKVRAIAYAILIRHEGCDLPGARVADFCDGVDGLGGGETN